MTTEEILQQIYNLLGELLGKEAVTAKPKCEYTFYAWLDFWLVNFKKKRLKPKSYKQLESVSRLHLKKHLPDRPLNELTSIDLQIALNDIKSSRMREYAKVTVSEALKKAKQLHFTSENVAEFVAVPQHRRKEGHALTKDEEQEFFEVARESSYYASFVFMRWTGCRPAEAFLTLWGDLDFDKKTIWLRGTKTEKSKRVVPMSKAVKETFEPFKCALKDIKLFGKQTAELCKKAIARLPLSFHVCCKDFRTTFATRCSENGVALKVLQKWLGHTTEKTTSKYYVKVLDDFEKKEAEKIDD